MRVRMFKRGPLAPTAPTTAARWVAHGTYAGTLDGCLEWLPRWDGGKGTAGREYLLVEQDCDQITKVVTIRLVEPQRSLNVEFI